MAGKTPQGREPKKKPTKTRRGTARTPQPPNIAESVQKEMAPWSKVPDKKKTGGS